MVLGDPGLGFDARKLRFQIFEILRIVLSGKDHQWLPGGLCEGNGAKPGQCMAGWQRQAQRIAGQFLKVQSSEHGRAGAHQESHLQFVFPNPDQHFFGGEIVQFELC